jgi:hypothetical protein
VRALPTVTPGRLYREDGRGPYVQYDQGGHRGRMEQGTTNSDTREGVLGDCTGRMEEGPTNRDTSKAVQ